MIIVGDERLKNFDNEVKRVLLIHHQKQRQRWVLVDINIGAKILTYYDSLLDTVEAHVLLETVNYARQKIAASLHEADLVLPLFQIALGCTLKQTDTSSCGPLAWREIEVLLGQRLQLNETPLSIRLRHYTSVIKAIVSQSEPRFDIKANVSKRFLLVDGSPPTSRPVKKARKSSPTRKAMFDKLESGPVGQGTR